MKGAVFVMLQPHRPRLIFVFYNLYFEVKSILFMQRKIKTLQFLQFYSMQSIDMDLEQLFNGGNGKKLETPAFLQ